MKNYQRQNEINNTFVRATWVLALASPLVGCGAEPGTDAIASSGAAAQPATSVDARRSLAITEQPIVQRFGLQRVMDRIVATSGVPGRTSVGLFQQW